MTTKTPARRQKAAFGMGISVKLADAIFTWSNLFFIGSLVVGVVSAFLIYISANIKEADFKRALSAANENIAAASVRVEEARAAASEADARAAEATQKAEEANLARVKLEEKLAPRTLNALQKSRILSRLINFPSMRVDVLVYEGKCRRDCKVYQRTRNRHQKMGIIFDRRHSYGRTERSDLESK